MASSEREQPVGGRSPASTDEAFDDDPRIVQAMEMFLKELEAGRHPDRDEFLAKFPEVATELAGHLEGLELLHGIAPCITSENSGQAAIADERLQPKATLGDFRLVRVIGRGGMGVVYEAEQLSLGRTVAVKVLPFAAMLDDQQLRRFRNEARAAATLDHPNIVPVHFVGQERSVHFYAMQLIEGQSLAEVVEDLQNARERGRGGEGETRRTADKESKQTLSQSLSVSPSSFFKSVARLGIQAAEALEHAHQAGIVHRDIKPGNLLVESTGKLWVTDFGLASYEQGEALTQTGGIVGTAAYMSPEQAAGSRLVDGRSDIYSLGATLYELLLLQRPEAAVSTKSHLSRTTPHEVTSLRRSDSRIPLDLETIILKAMSLEPADRYETAQAMADDLRRFVEGHEIRARRLRVAERSGRWIRRHRKVATTLIVGGVIVLAGVIAALALYSREVRQYAESVETALATAQAAEETADEERKLAEAHRLRAERSELQTRRMSYRSDMQFAFDCWDRGQLNDASRILERQTPTADQSDLRGLEWYILYAGVRNGSQLLGSHDGPATECVVLPDDLTVASAGEDGLVHIWDLAIKAKRETFTPGIGPIHAMAISPDGSTLAIGGKPALQTLDMARVYLLDAQTGKRVGAIQRHPTTIESIAFSPDGKLIAAGSRYTRVEVSTLTGETVYACPTEKVRNKTISFSPDGQQLAFIVNKGVEHARSVHLQTGEVVTDIVQPESHLLMWWPGGQMLATSRWGYVDVYSVGRQDPHFRTLPATKPHPQQLSCIWFNKAGTELVAGDDRGRLHWWRCGEDWQPEGTYESVNTTRCLQVYEERINNVCIAAGGSVVSTCIDGTVKLVEAGDGLERHGLSTLPIMSMEATRGGELFLGCYDGTVRRTDTRMEAITNLCQPFDEPIVDVDVTVDGSRLGVVSATGRICVLDAGTGDATWSIAAPSLSADEGPAFVADLSADGRWLASTGVDNVLRIRDVETQRELLSYQTSADGRSVAFSQDGSLVAFGSDRIHVFETESGKLVRESRAGNNVLSLQFSSASDLLASGHQDGSIRVISPQDDSTSRILRSDHVVQSVAFSRDGKSLLGVDPFRGLHFWDVATGESYGAIDLPRTDYSERRLLVTDTHLVATTISWEPTTASTIENVPETTFHIWDLDLFRHTTAEPSRQ